MSKSVAFPVAMVLALILTQLAPTRAEGRGHFRHKRSCPCPEPVQYQSADSPKAMLATGPTPNAVGIKICMVCDGDTYRPATEGEFGICEIKDASFLDKPCVRVYPPLAAGAPAAKKSCEPWCWLYCDKCTGWRFPRNCCERKQSYYLPISHYGRKCWYP